MCLQCSGTTKNFTTYLTLTRNISPVCNVSLQSCGTHEGFSTFLTFMRFSSSMNLFIFYKGREKMEGFSTFFTFILFSSIMTSLMVFTKFVVIEGFATFFTRIWLLSICLILIWFVSVWHLMCILRDEWHIKTFPHTHCIHVVSPQEFCCSDWDLE